MDNDSFNCILIIVKNLIIPQSWRLIKIAKNFRFLNVMSSNYAFPSLIIINSGITRFRGRKSTRFSSNSDNSLLVAIFNINPHTPVTQKVADEVVLRSFQGEGVEFF